MKRLLNFCEKNGIEYSPEKYGATYFENAPALHIDGVQVVFEIPENQPVSEVDFLRFCKKAGYSVFCFGAPGFHVVNVMKKADRAALELYNEYMKKSVESCEKLIHENATGVSKETPADFNRRLSGVMDFFGNEYNAARLAAEKTVA